MQIRQTIINYLQQRQTPTIRFFHIAILFLVLSQIIVSNFIDFNDNGEISRNFIGFYGTWIHIITGLLLVPLALLFTFIELKQRGFNFFFPYLSGDNEQLKADFNQLKKLQLPEPSDKGLAAAVQGLGLGALLLVVFSGLIWFIAWINGVSWAEDIQEIHGFLTGLVITYFFAHGFMGVLHIFLSKE